MRPPVPENLIEKPQIMAQIKGLDIGALEMNETSQGKD
jgi:hypothetical protein